VTHHGGTVTHHGGTVTHHGGTVTHHGGTVTHHVIAGLDPVISRGTVRRSMAGLAVNYNRPSRSLHPLR
ncbi:MAG: hypothetical protein ABSA58_17660, partial [Acetobacteraceae bacterium]